MTGAKYARYTCKRMAICLTAALAIATLGACSGQKKAAEMKTALESVARLQEGVVDYATNKQHWPTKMDDLKVDGDPMPGVSYVAGEGGVIAIYFADGSALAGGQLVYTPTQDANGVVTWACNGKGIEATLMPTDCKAN